MRKKNYYFADRLRTARKKAGLTQRELAEALDISLSTIKSWEKGTQPLLENGYMIARFFELPVSYFLETE